MPSRCQSHTYAARAKDSMEHRFTRGEYWLLETVVKMEVPICYVNSTSYAERDGLESMFNKPEHGLDTDRLTETLHELFCAGFIEAFRGDAYEVAFAPSLDEIVAALWERGPRHNPLCTCYRLTARGGEAWESFAAPRWERFVLEEIQYDEPGPIPLTSMTSWCVSALLENLKLVCFEIDESFGYSTTLGEWKATYWKSLPSGFRTHTRWLREFPDPWSDELRNLAFSGYCARRDAWYRWR